MADSKKISELTNSLTESSIANADLFVVVDTDASETKKITREDLKQDMLAGNADTATAADSAAAVGVAATTDASCSVALFEGVSSPQNCKTDTGLTYNATTNALTAGSFSNGVSNLLAIADIVGVQDMWIPAAAMRPTDTDGCEAIASVDSGGNTGPDLQVLDFPVAADKFAQFSVCMPKSWDSSNITFKAYWVGISATTDVAWALGVKSLGDGEDINVAFGTEGSGQETVVDTAQSSVTKLLISPVSDAIACGGADSDLLFCQIWRDVSGGAMDGAARLVGIMINYTTSALNDA